MHRAVYVKGDDALLWLDRRKNIVWPTKVRSAPARSGIACAEKYTSECFRRWHAETLRMHKGCLCVILRAGGWGSRAFAGY